MCEWGPSIHLSRNACLEGGATGVSVAPRVGVLGRHGERDGSSVLEAAPFAVRIQSQADREALGWGLLAWEDPRRTDGPASPFWARAPMLDGQWGPEAPGRGRFRRSQKRPVPSGAIFCWVTVRVRRDRSGRARRRRMEWDTQGCFTPRAMWLIGSGFRRARLRAAGSRARDRCFTDSAARCVTSGPMLISGWRRSGESQRPTRARHFEWPCDGSAANRLGGRPANRTRRTIRWVQVNGFRWDRIRRIGHCPLDDKKWGTMSTDRNRSVRLRHPPAAQWSSACTANRSPSSADAYHSCPPTVPRPDGTITPR